MRLKLVWTDLEKRRGCGCFLKGAGNGRNERIWCGKVVREEYVGWGEDRKESSGCSRDHEG